MEPDERASIVPVGTVTFLTTELDQASRQGETAPGRSGVAIDRHFELVTAVALAHGGKPADDEERVGPAVAATVIAAFPSAAEAAAAALEIQTTLESEHEPGRPDLRVRIGLHTGEALLYDDRRYTGATLQHGVRLRDLAHGGQTLLSSATASAVAEMLPPGSWLDDLGSHRLWDLSRPERVFELRHADLAHDFPPLRSLDTVANNLPTQLTSFVGRDGELAAVDRLLSREQMVTLTGSGGCGKTRLALQAAAKLAGRWPDGVWWVDLAPVAEPARVAESVAAAIGVLVEPVMGPQQALAVQLRDKRLLVCLDNCEHLLDASAELAEALLLSCPEVSVLATSREPLGVVGETVWRVPSLADEEAVALFIERASRVRPWFTLDETNEAAVRALCRQLDGIPLAVELAAAWLRTLTPAQIATGLDDRFRLLVGGPRGASARQQTLAASMAWSHDLLDEPDRAVLRRLAVFAGGFTLDAARSVCAADPIAEPDVLPALGRLVDKSLVVMDERDGDARYRLLETTRQYAAERLDDAGETPAGRTRHLDHCLDFAETAEREMEGEDHDVWLTRLETEHDNVLAALQWGLRPAADDGPTGAANAEGVGDSAAARDRAARDGAAAGLPERARRLAAALVGLWHLHGHVPEGIEMLQRAIELAPEDRSALQARLLYGLARVAGVAVRLDVTLDAAQQGMEIASENGDDRIRGRCLLLSALARFYLDAETARELCVQARDCAEAAGDLSTVDAALVVEGSILSSRDRHEAARPLLQEGLERCLARGDREFATMALVRQVHAAVFGGETRLGRRLALQAVQAAEPLEDYYSVGTAVGQLAWVEGISGDIEAGHRLMEPTVRSIEGVDQDVYVPWLATVSGMLCLWDGDLEGARRWFERDLDGFDPSAGTVVAARVLPGLTTALRRLGRLDEARAQAERAVALTRDLDMPHMEAEALEQMGLLTSAAGVGAGRADDAGGASGEAANLHHQALALRVDHGLRIFCVDSLENLADLAARTGSFTEAVRLLAASDAARDEMGYPRPPVQRPDYETTLAELRSALDDVALAEAWGEGAALPLDDAVAYARRARGARDRPSNGWASLTPTELDVVRLVAEGLTNPEIGARLFMSRATVKTHLSHVYAKLGVANRIELATLANTQTADPRSGSD